MFLSIFFYLFLTATDQNFYFQSPQRFQSPFPASRNGFFPSNGVPSLTVQNLPSRSPLRSGLQPQPPHQSQEQSTLFGAIPSKIDDSNGDYFQYSSFPVSFQFSNRC